MLKKNTVDKCDNPPPPIENTQQNRTVSEIGVQKNDFFLSQDTSPLLLVAGPCFFLFNSPLFQVNSLPSTDTHNHI